MLAVGYSDYSQAFIVRNSWGTTWVSFARDKQWKVMSLSLMCVKGDKGYCYIPYGYMTNTNWCTSLYTVKQTADDSLGNEQWLMEDEENYFMRDNDFGKELDDIETDFIIDENEVDEEYESMDDDEVDNDSDEDERITSYNQNDADLHDADDDNLEEGSA
jgi:hypothetical protein